MEHLRSKSCNDPRMQVGNNTYHNYNSHNFNSNGEAPNYNPSSDPNRMQDLRCYSASSAENNRQMDIVVAGGGDGGCGERWEFKKGKSTSGVASKSWSFSDPELKRKKRVASYKAYTVEGKVKGSIKKSFRWLKERLLR